VSPLAVALPVLTQLAAGFRPGLVNYWVYVLLMMIGLYAVMARENLIKKVMGLSLFQTGIFIFYISTGVVAGGTVPIYWPAEVQAERAEAARAALAETSLTPAEQTAVADRIREALEEHDVRAAADALPATLPSQERLAVRKAMAPPKPYGNPLPHVLILTAIVVSVSTMAVALALIISIKRTFGTVEADELLELEENQVGPQPGLDPEAPARG
jgi:multicomponent Na+:H+ antiporter subunit C